MCIIVDILLHNEESGPINNYSLIVRCHEEVTEEIGGVEGSIGEDRLIVKAKKTEVMVCPREVRVTV